MNSLLSTPPPVPPHLHGDTLRASNHLAPFHLQSPNMYRKKRKASEEGFDEEKGGSEGDDRMSTSPSASPAISSRPIPRSIASPNKRFKSNITGRPLAVHRFLEVLDAPALRQVLQSLSDRHPEINSEMFSLAAPPTVDAALGVLTKYETNLQNSFPYGGNQGSDYAYNRVRQALTELLDALSDYTPHFLPPNESQMTISLSYLDGATNIIHRLPTWTNAVNNHHKNLAYEEISKAWALVIREAAKKGAGIQLQYGGWDQKLAKHNEQAQGRMSAAMQELSQSLDWMGGSGSGSNHEMGSIRQQLQSGTYGTNTNSPVRVGPW
ncbi:MAG: Tethering factor for nuclear proteasome sts1 [Watsoniomyces obsoletus]|nr:MAG: Tethering factor for nuclear proteasome sts1 [Watsoniomyces obsoletus]